MKRLLIISDTVKRKTGYSTVARNIIKNLLETNNYQIAQLGLGDVPVALDLKIDYYSPLKDHSHCCGKGVVIEHKSTEKPELEYITFHDKVHLHSNQKPCFKAPNDGSDQYAYTSIVFVIQHFKPDIVVPINDIWALYNIAHLVNRECFKFVPYLAIDSDCLFPHIENPAHRPGLPSINSTAVLGSADKIVVFTEWAKNVINKTVMKVTKGKQLNNIIVIPHGVDISEWKPLSNKQELRKKYFNIDDSVFLIGSIARNQPRKRLDAIFPIMRKFIDQYEKPNKKIMCYFHCCLTDKMGWDLLWLARWYNLEDRCIFDPNLKPGSGPTVDDFNEMINCFDVHLSLTNSEGWMLPALETAAAGIPNVITKYSAHADWGKDTFLFVKIAAYFHDAVTNFIKAIADNDHAASQIKLLYDSPKMHRDYSNRGIKLAEKLQWKNICAQWVKLFDSIDVSDLKPDRYDTIPIELDSKHSPMAIKFLPNDIEDVK